MTREIELKLDLDSTGADALEASGLHRQPGRVQRMAASYFDTPDHALRRSGLSLRIRETDGTWVQTVKQDGASAAGLFARAEWEMPVSGTGPESDPRTPIAALLGPDAAALIELFTVRTERKCWRIAMRKSEIELAIDRGEVVAGGRREPFCEAELELIHGEPSALFTMARGIDGIAPGRLGVLTKPERGYRLLGPLLTSVRANKLVLRPDMAVPEAFVAIVQDCIRQYRLNEAILLTRRVPEAVHQARVALRRLRSALTLFRALHARPELQAMQSRLRNLAAALGEARDLDVLSAEVASTPLAHRLSLSRDAAYTRLEQALAGEEPRRLMLDLAAWLECGGWRHDPATAEIRALPLLQFAATALDRLRRRVRSHGKHLTELSEEARHELRKDAKKLRYGIEFFASLFTRGKQKLRRRAFVAALQGLQDDLGALNDRAVAEERLDGLGIAAGPELERIFAGWDKAALLDGSAEARRALLDARPFWR